MSKLLKIMPNKFENASRNKRELSTVKELGHEVIIIAKGETNEIKMIDGFEVHCRTTRPLGNNNLIVNINRLVSLFTWASYARKIEPDVISGHDLIGLFIGWLSTLFIPKKRRPLLVYDSHEFELGRNTVGKKSRLRNWRVFLMEKYLTNKSFINIMVSDSIADEVQKNYNLADRPIVVRNIPQYYYIDEKTIKDKRKEICDKLCISNDAFLAMYHGGITRGRGIEKLIQAIGFVNGAALIILGYGEINYIAELNQLIDDLNRNGNVHFLDAVPVDMLWKYIGAADVGMSTIENVSRSYYYSLPNKLFESIQSLTPIIGSDFPEIKKIIEGYDIGICCDPHDVNDIANAIRKLKEDRDLYSKFKINLKKAKKELCWENEKKVLIDAYSNVFDIIENRNKK